MDKYSLCGIEFRRMSNARALGELGTALKKNTQTIAFTPNLQMISSASRDKRLVTLLNSADILLPDGIGIRLACRKNGLPPVEKIAGIDAAYSLLRYASVRGYRVFLLGGKKGIAELAAKNLKSQFPALTVCGTHHGYFDKHKKSPQNKAVLKKIRDSKPHILFVCFGFPTQEAWIKQNAPSLPSVRLFMGLGGSLDVWSGKLHRAPRVFQKLNLEWLWRCACEPKRIIPLVKNMVTFFSSEVY